MRVLWLRGSGIRRTRTIGRPTLAIAAILCLVIAARAAPMPRLNLTAVHFVSETSGWGLTDTAVVRTDDVGQTWRNVTPPGLTFRSDILPATAFVGATNAWIGTGYLEHPSTPGIVHTTDGGRTWRYVAMPRLPGGPLAISELDFVDSRHGWALESLGGGAGSFYFALLRTADGGVHWSSLAITKAPKPPVPGSFPFNVLSIGLDSTGRGWATQVIGANPRLSGLYTSLDGGRIWRRVAIPVVGAFSTGFLEMESPVFFGARDGAILVTTDRVLGIYATKDGGKMWTATTPLSVGPFRALPAQADFIDLAHTWVIANSRLYFTADLGRHWSLKRQPFGFGRIASVDYVDARTGWVLGGYWDGAGHVRSFLRKTRDGGRTWAVLEPALAQGDFMLGSRQPQ